MNTNNITTKAMIDAVDATKKQKPLLCFNRNSFSEDGMFEELCHLLNVPNEARNEAEYIDIEVNRCAIYGEGQGELLFGEDLLS